jgi:hypothetical protein
VIIGLFVGGVLALALFCRVETRAREPMLPMRLFTNPVFTALAPNLRDGVAQAARTGDLDPAALGRAATSPEGVHELPSAAAAPIVGAYADTLQTVFLWTVPVAALGFLVALFLKQVRLRDTARTGSTDMGEGFGRRAARTPDGYWKSPSARSSGARIRTPRGGSSWSPTPGSTWPVPGR